MLVLIFNAPYYCDRFSLLMAVCYVTRLLSYGPRETLGVIVEILNLEWASARFLQTKRLKMLRICTTITSEVGIAHARACTLIQILRSKLR